MSIYKDERGEIIDVWEGDFKALQLIFSKKGTVRSNHYHKTGGHLLHVLKGKMRYLEKPVDGGEIEDTIINEGDSVFTGPMLIHTTEFLENTVLICCATAKRSGSAYDDDLVRVPSLISGGKS
jgi:quercetin dioxygenase-like cupin family protein